MGVTTHEEAPTVVTSRSAPSRSPDRRRRLRGIGLSLAGPVAFLFIWQAAVSWLSLVDEFIMPPPSAVFSGARELLADGTLQNSTGTSMFRILTGWAVGSALAIPIGLIVGASIIAKQLIDPFVHFFRFVPPIALITIFILWFGVGETSKVALVVYSTTFVVLVNVATGVAAVPKDKLFAARCLGANRWQVFLYVIGPAAIPYIFAGMRIAMAAAFVVIVAVEMIAANSGLGYLIWTSRLYFRLDWVFTGVIAIGVLGFLTDRAWLLCGRKLFARYLRHGGGY